jgi:protein phosphatase
LIQITKDHSIVQSLIEQERITEQARYLHPQRNQITRCLGHEPQIALDAFLVTLEPGDRLLLCSDGLWEMIPDEEHLARLLAQEKALQAICDDLLSAALAGGGRDNVSALLVQLAPGPVQH